MSTTEAALRYIGANAGTDVQTQGLLIESKRLPQNNTIPKMATNGCAT